MTITSVSTSTFLADATIFLRDKLRSNITDPISSSRPTTSSFVMTSYPTRLVVYPLIVVKVENIQEQERLGVGSEMHALRLPIYIRVYARNVVEREELSQQVLNYLRGIETDAGGSIAANLHDFMIESSVVVDDDPAEDGTVGYRSRVLTVGYNFIFGAT